MNVEILSQMPAPAVNGNWGAFFALVAILIKDLGKWIAESRRDKIVDKLEMERQVLASRTADSNEEAVKVLAEIKGKLQEEHVINRIRNENLSRTVYDAQVAIGVVNGKLDNVCKGTCNLREPMIKPKSAFDSNKTFP